MHRLNPFIYLHCPTIYPSHRIMTPKVKASIGTYCPEPKIALAVQAVTQGDDIDHHQHTLSV
jgi:hypothetical protein